MKRFHPLPEFLFSIVLISCARNTGTSTSPLVENGNDKVNNKSPFDMTGIGEAIYGDFDGDGGMDTAIIHLLKTGSFQTEPWKMSVDFSSPGIASIPIDADNDYAFLINEGDLNNFPGEEISVLLPPLNGNWNFIQPYTFANGKWSYLFEGFMTPSSVLFLNQHDVIDSNYIEIGDRIYSENDSIYYYDYQNFELPEGEQEFRFAKIKAALN